MNHLTMKPLHLSLTCIASLLLLTGWSHAQQIIHEFDFSNQPEGSALPWLKRQGFEFKLGLENLKPRFENGVLRVSTDVEEAGLFGYVFPEGKELKSVKRLKIEWGVDVFPDGADWEHGINRVPLAIMISFGRERLSSGLPFGIYAAPYFISPFIGKMETDGKAFTGRLWKEGGRYVAVQMISEGTPMTSVIELDSLFNSLFSKAPTPPVTAIGIQMNTKDTKGKASAWVKRLEFLGD